MCRDGWLRARNPIDKQNDTRAQHSGLREGQDYRRCHKQARRNDDQHTLARSLSERVSVLRWSADADPMPDYRGSYVQVRNSIVLTFILL